MMDSNYFGITDTGKVRDNNEDTFVAEKIAGTDYILACVIDGVGGYTGGEVAAEIAKETILKLMDSPSGDLVQLMQHAIIEANHQILTAKHQNKEHEDMACVLSIAISDLKNNQFHYAHVGDTRLYLLRDNSLIKISKDQSFVGFLEDSGRLTEEQAMQHPKRNEINKALGFPGSINGRDDDIETGQSPFLPGDMIMLCTDGLSDMVNKESITNILLKDHTLEQKGTALIDLANANGGRDNITVVLVKNNKATFVHEATKPISQPKKRKSAAVIPVVNPSTAEQVAPGNNVTSTPKPDKKQSRKSNTILLFIAFMVIGGITFYMFRQHNESELISNQKPDSITLKPSQAFKLQDTLDKLKGNILILDTTIFKSPILITEPIRINRDSLYLKAEMKLVIKSDSGYKGPAFLISPSNKSTLLENLTFENFDNVSALQKKGVLLKNVQFIRTDAPLVKQK